MELLKLMYANFFKTLILVALVAGIVTGAFKWDDFYFLVERAIFMRISGQ